MLVEWMDGGVPHSVGQKNGTSPLSANFNQYLSHASLNYGSGTVGGVTDAPIHNPDETYRFTLTVGTTTCGTDSYFGYFSVPNTLILNKTENQSFVLIQSASQEIMVVATPNKNSSKASSAIIYNLTGQKIAQVYFENDRASFSNVIPKGVYVVHVYDLNGNTLWAEKLIK